MDLIYVLNENLAPQQPATATTVETVISSAAQPATSTNTENVPSSTQPEPPEQEIAHADPVQEQVSAQLTADQRSTTSPVCHGNALDLSHVLSPAPSIHTAHSTPPHPSIAASTLHSPTPLRLPTPATIISQFRRSPMGRPRLKPISGGKEYWTQAEDELLISLVRNESTDGRKHWKVISSKMQRSPEACRTRWKNVAKGLRTFKDFEEAQLSGLLSTLMEKVHEICAERMEKTPEEVRDAIPFLGKPRPKGEREELEASPQVLKRTPYRKRRRRTAKSNEDDEDDSMTETSPSQRRKRCTGKGSR